MVNAYVGYLLTGSRTMRLRTIAVCVGLIALTMSCVRLTRDVSTNPAVKAQHGRDSFADESKANADRMYDEGKRVFRDDTFGSEAFWGGTLQLHRAILGETQGGVGPGLTPKDAL